MPPPPPLALVPLIVVLLIVSVPLLSMPPAPPPELFPLMVLLLIVVRTPARDSGSVGLDNGAEDLWRITGCTAEEIWVQATSRGKAQKIVLSLRPTPARVNGTEVAFRHVPDGDVCWPRNQNDAAGRYSRLLMLLLPQHEEEFFNSTSVPTPRGAEAKGTPYRNGA